jgi:hypothetical protein
MQEGTQAETGEVLLSPFDLLEGISESTRAKTAETFLELLGARVRNPNTRSPYRVAWRSFLVFCSARRLELESVKAYHVGAWLDQHPGSRSTQRQHLAAVRLLFDSLMMRGIVEYNPAARARPPRLVRESSHTAVFEARRNRFCASGSSALGASCGRSSRRTFGRPRQGTGKDDPGRRASG